MAYLKHFEEIFFVLSIKHYNFVLSFNNMFFLLGSIIIHLIYVLLLFKGYKVGDLSIVYPVARGSAPMMTVIIASVLFNEKLSVIAYLGIIFGTLIGVKVLNEHFGLNRIIYAILITIGVVIIAYTTL